MQTYKDILSYVQRLSPADKVRLLEDISASLRHELTPSAPSPKHTSLYGLLKDLGQSPSEDDIDAMRREMMADFPREDI
jgi:Mg/Co/Ni transporter MgtE